MRARESIQKPTPICRYFERISAALGNHAVARTVERVARGAACLFAARSGEMADAISPGCWPGRGRIPCWPKCFHFWMPANFWSARRYAFSRRDALVCAGGLSWLSGVWAEAHREPLGHVLVIAPSNFPLFLAGTQVLQALAAGNSVTWKPGNGGGVVAELMQTILHEAGLPTGLLQVTGESVEAGREAVRRGADKVVSQALRWAGAQCCASWRKTQTPAVMELVRD